MGRKRGPSIKVINMRILGVSLGTILLVVIVAVIVRKYGSSIPLLKSVQG